jgi:hypothetical protein
MAPMLKSTRLDRKPLTTCEIFTQISGIMLTPKLEKHLASMAKLSVMQTEKKLVSF